MLQSTSLWSDIRNDKLLTNFIQEEEDISVPPLMLGGSAFPFESFLMKPYSNAVLKQQQRYFNYRLSSARIVIESAYGPLKGRWLFVGFLSLAASMHYKSRVVGAAHV